MLKNICLAALLLFFSCDSSENCCVNYEVDIFVKTRDSTGKDLLAPGNGAIDPDSIKIFYLTGSGEKKEVNKPNLDSPKGYRVIAPSVDNSNDYKIQLFLNADYVDSQNISHTYVQWNAGSTDAIKAEFKRHGKGLSVSKVWVNDALKWEPSKDRVITIIK